MKTFRNNADEALWRDSAPEGVMEGQLFVDNAVAGHGHAVADVQIEDAPNGGVPPATRRIGIFADLLFVIEPSNLLVTTTVGVKAAEA